MLSKRGWPEAVCAAINPPFDNNTMCMLALASQIVCVISLSLALSCVLEYKEASNIYGFSDMWMANAFERRDAQCFKCAETRAFNASRAHHKFPKWGSAEHIMRGGLWPPHGASASIKSIGLHIFPSIGQPFFYKHWPASILF